MSLTYTSGFSLNNLRQKLMTRENVFNEKIQEALKEGAVLIKEKSQSNSPVDTHNLETAHKIIPGVTRKGYTSLSVEVSGTGQGSENDRDVEAYALEVHENYTSMGPKSAEKLAQGHEVGGKYLERAVESEKPKVVAKARKAAKEAF